MANSDRVNQFIAELQIAERNSDTGALCDLFTADAELLNLTRHNTSSRVEHRESPALFWRQYLSAFQTIESNLHHTLDDGRTAVLEWNSSGVLPMGLPIDYSGVTILEFEGDKISRLRTYYDSAAFLPHTPFRSQSLSQSVGAAEINISASS